MTIEEALKEARLKWELTKLRSGKTEALIRYIKDDYEGSDRQFRNMIKQAWNILIHRNSQVEIGTREFTNSFEQVWQAIEEYHPGLFPDKQEFYKYLVFDNEEDNY